MNTKVLSKGFSWKWLTVTDSERSTIVPSLLFCLCFESSLHGMPTYISPRLAAS